jgi:hypothetical protein
VKAWPASLRGVLSHGLVRWLIWVLFAIVFYQSGLTATVWLMEPETFRGGIDWLWLGLFPALLPLFFVVNRLCGCASGACAVGDRNARSPYPPAP